MKMSSHTFSHMMQNSTSISDSRHMAQNQSPNLEFNFTLSLLHLLLYIQINKLNIEYNNIQCKTYIHVCCLSTQVSWPSGWAFGLKVLVPSSTRCALQFESGYLHFKKTFCANDLVESFEDTLWETLKKKKNQHYMDILLAQNQCVFVKIFIDKIIVYLWLSLYFASMQSIRRK